MKKALQQHASPICKMKCSQKSRAACISQKIQTPDLLSLRENTNLFIETEVNNPLKAENRLLSYYSTQCVFQGWPESEVS